MITPLAPGASHAEFARYYTRAGFGLVHVPQGKKGPIHQGWQRNALSDPDQAIQYWTQHPHDNMGALLWKSRLVSLDIDNVKLAQQALAAVGIDLECLLNAPPIPRIEGNPKKAKLLFRLPEGVDLQSHKLRLQGREGCTVLELRAGRHQDLLPPSEHPDTGKPYRWLRAPWEVEEIPVPPVKLLELWQNWPKFERDMRAAIEGHPEPDVLAKAINEYETFQGHSNGEWNRVREMICQQLSVKELLSQMGEQERGKNKYLCLFHSEKSPSFWLHETLWICAHGGAPVGLTGPSGYSVGDVIDLYQWANSLDSPGKATTALARELRIDLRVGNGGVTHVPSDNPKTGGSLSNSPVDERIGQTVSTPTWKEPESLPTILPAVEPFDAKLLPEAFRPWVEDAAERMQCPPDFMAVSCMVALAAVVGRQIGIRPKQKDDWLVVPNLWGAAVGRPGTLKTAALQEPLNALELLEARARNRYEAERKGYEAAQLVADERKKIKREEIRKALKVDKNPEQLALEAVKEEAEPGRQRYVVNDTTIEKLGEILNANPRGVLLFRDELTGFLKSLDKNDREGDRSFYLEAWNGSTPHTYDRIGRGTVDIQAACVSILGGIQPGPLSHYVRRMAQGDANNDGLLQRFQLAVWPDLSDTWTNHDRIPNLQARHTAYSVFDRLDHVDSLALGGQQEEGSIPYLRFTPEAQVEFNKWLTVIENRFRSKEESDFFVAHLSKFRSLVPSLALLIHLADEGRGQVDITALIRACAWAEYLESHARRIYAPAMAPTVSSAHALADRLQKSELKSGFTLRELYRKHWHALGTKEEAQGAVDMLEELNWLHEVQERTEGRWTARYEVSPLIGEGHSG